MNNITLVEVEELINNSLLPTADYTDLNSFLNTISNESLGEMIALYESQEEGKLQFLSYVVASLFMFEYEQKECTEVDLVNLSPQFYRQCVAEALTRIGIWSTSEEERRFIPTTEPIELPA